MSSRANARSNVGNGPIRPPSIRPPSSSSHHSSQTTTSTATTTIEPPSIFGPPSTVEPPPAPSRQNTRNLAAPHLARRPPAYSTARTVNVVPAARRDVQRRDLRTAASPISWGNGSLEVPVNTFGPRYRSRSREVTRVREESDEGDEGAARGEEGILTEGWHIGGLDGLYASQAELLDLQGDDMDWDEEESLDKQIIDLFMERRRCVELMGE